jgi:hypothetical protein
MAVLHPDGSNRTRDETGPDYSYFHLNAFLRIALICIAVFNDMVVVSLVWFSCFFSGFEMHPLTHARVWFIACSLARSCQISAIHVEPSPKLSKT